MNETVRSYTRCFFEMRATIANITDEDIIRCFQNGLFSKHTYHDFGRNRPTTAVELCDMMARWTNQEDEENDHFPKRNHDKQSNGNGHFDKSQRNHSENNRERKPDHEVATIEGNLRGKKSGDNDSKYEKVMHKQCPIHPKSQHTIFECVTIRKSLNAPPLPQAGKRKNKEDDEEGNKLGAQDFHDPKNVINVIFGGDGGFPSKRAQKQTLRETLSMEPATTRPLRYSEVPISFSKDDQWASFSEPRKFPLVLDPVVAGLQLTRVLIDGGSGLNTLFVSTLKKMGLDISKMLTPSKAPFYGIVPGNAAIPLGSVVLPVTFGTKDNYRTRVNGPASHLWDERKLPH
jgi:hypothetical protein